MIDLGYCPSCGVNLAPFAPMTIGSLSVAGPGGPFRWRGRIVPLSPTQRCILMPLIRRPNLTVGFDALIGAGNIGEESGNQRALLRVFIVQIRNKFLSVDESFDALQSDWGAGYRWEA